MSTNNYGVTAKAIRPTPPPPPPIETVTLTMPHDVARTLICAMNKVGGPPGDTYRGHTDAIALALAAAGVEDMNGRERFVNDYSLWAKPFPG